MSGYTIPNVVAQHPRGDRIMDVYSHLLSERIIYLGTAIDAGVANALIAQLLHLEADKPDQEINLYINCEGGDMTAMLAIYLPTARLDDAMRARLLDELRRAAQSLTGASETTISSPSSQTR